MAMRQLMAGAREFSLNLISRDDIAALTEEASRVSGIPQICDLDKEAAWEVIKA